MTQNLETTQTRSVYKQQEQRILMRSELTDEQKDNAIDSLFDRYCADHNCYESNARSYRLTEGYSDEYRTESSGSGEWVWIFSMIGLCFVMMYFPKEIIQIYNFVTSIFGK